MSDFNEKFDKELKVNCLISKEVYNKFIEAWEYDAASTVNWLLSKLKILIEELDSGRKIYIKHPENKLIGSFSEFSEWILSNFDGFLLDTLKDNAIYEAIEFNRLFDERIKKTRIITHKDLLKFDDAYNSDSSASINWLISKLKIVTNIIKSGDYILINDSPIKEIYTKKGLSNWISERYSLISNEDDL